jgi:hypothetical protein
MRYPASVDTYFRDTVGSGMEMVGCSHWGPLSASNRNEKGWKEKEKASWKYARELSVEKSAADGKSCNGVRVAPEINWKLLGCYFVFGQQNRK